MTFASQYPMSRVQDGAHESNHGPPVLPVFQQLRPSTQLRPSPHGSRTRRLWPRTAPTCPSSSTSSTWPTYTLERQPLDPDAAGEQRGRGQEDEAARMIGEDVRDELRAGDPPVPPAVRRGVHGSIAQLAHFCLGGPFLRGLGVGLPVIARVCDNRAY